MTGATNREMMSQMAEIAVERATEMFARQAEEFARSLPADVDGKTAMRAFANAIRATNAKAFPTKGGAA